MKKRKPLKSAMGWSTRDSITVRGRNLSTELLGKIDLGGMAFLEIKGRLRPGRKPKSPTHCWSRWLNTA